MRHDEDIHSFRCNIAKEQCVGPGPIGVAVSTAQFSAEWYWYTVTGALSTILTGGSEDGCASADQCDDADSCTKDTCHAGCCEHERSAACTTEADGFKSPTAMLQYIARVAAGPWTDIAVGGAVSPTSNADDYPPEVIDLPFTVPFFDELVSKIAISPNGLVNIGPSFSCVAFASSIFGTCTAKEMFHTVALSGPSRGV
jgi:hypothetical protein